MNELEKMLLARKVYELERMRQVSAILARNAQERGDFVKNFEYLVDHERICTKLDKFHGMLAELTERVQISE